MNSCYQEEYKLLKELSPLSSPQVIASAYGTLMAPLLKLFNTVLTQLLTLLKKSLSKYNFLALSAYDGLLSLQPHWNDLLSRRGADHAEDKNELKEGLHALRALCLRSFPEFLADLKLGAMARGSDTGTKLMDFTISVRVSVFSSREISIKISLYSDCQIYRKYSTCSECRWVCPPCTRRRKLEDGRRCPSGQGYQDRRNRSFKHCGTFCS